MASMETGPLFFTVKMRVGLEVFTATLEKVAGEGEMVSGPVPRPVIVAESLWALAPETVTVPFAVVRATGVKSTSLKQSGVSRRNPEVGVGVPA